MKIANRLILILFVGVIVSTSIHAQTSVVQSSDGKTSIVNSNNRGVAFNFKSSKISAAYGFAKSKPKDFLFIKGASGRFSGFETSFKSSEGISSILNEGELVPQADLGLFYGWLFKKPVNNANYEKANRFNKLYAVVKGETTQLNILDQMGAVDTKGDQNLSFTLGFNRTGVWKCKKCKKVDKLDDKGKVVKDSGGKNVKLNTWNWAVWGTSFVIGQTNNLDDLKKEEMRKVRFSSDSTQIFAGSPKTVYGPSEHAIELDRSVMNFQWNFDFLFYPQKLNPLAFGFYNRLEYQAIQKFEWVNNFGLAFMLGKKSDISQIVGGLTVEFGDTFDTTDSENDFAERISVNLVVGYPLR